MARRLIHAAATVLLVVCLSPVGFGQMAPVQSTIAGGLDFTLFVRNDGSVWSVGGNNDGQLGDNSQIARKTPVRVTGVTGVVGVAAGGVHSLALTASGIVYAWGDNAHGQIGDASTSDRRAPLPLALANVAAIAAGEFHSVALTSTGDVYTWGENGSGQLGTGSTIDRSSPVLVLTGVIGIGAGLNHTLAAKDDGTVWAWGANTSGQLGNGMVTTVATTSPVQMLNVAGAVAVYGGGRRSVMRLSDGTLKAVGENSAGQLGDATSTDRSTAVAVGSLTEVRHVALGVDHALALKDDGSVWAWGENSEGRLGIGTEVDARTPVLLPSLVAAQFVGVGWRHSMAVDETGVVFTWGKNSASQLGDGTVDERWVPVSISDVGYAWRVGTPTFNVSTGTYTTDRLVVVTVDTAGATIHYTQNGNEPTEADPVVASGASILVTYTQTLRAKAWKTGTLPSHIRTATYTLQAATPTMTPGAGTYSTARTVVLSTATAGAAMRYTRDGSEPTESSALYAGAITVEHTTTLKARAFRTGWIPSDLRTSVYTMNFGTLSAPMLEPPSGAYTGSSSVSMSAPQSLAVIRYTTDGASPTKTNSLVYTGPLTISRTQTIKARAFHDDYAISAETSRTYTIAAATPTLSAAGGSHSPGSAVTVSSTEMSLPSSPTLRMTIDGSEPTSTSTVIVSGSTLLIGNFILKVKAFRAGASDSAVASATYTLSRPLGAGAVANGGSHSVLATTDGRVYAWGENGSGQLGNENTTDRLLPTLLNTVSGVTTLAAGLSHTLARTWDGRVYAWGQNTAGRLGLGDGSTTNRARPTAIPALSNIVSLAAGDAHSLALNADGRVFAWGDNASGQLGLGPVPSAVVPTEVVGIANAIAIAAGDTHSFALTSGGHLYAWGSNGSGRLGDGTTTNRSTPVLINLPDVVAIAAGAAHSVALLGSGAVFTWGLGTNGQLGHGSISSASRPTQLASLNASAIAAGDNHSAAIRIDGLLVAWGSNSVGQLGDASTTQRTVPVLVNGPSSVSAVALGDVHSTVVTPDGSVWTWGESGSGRLGDNQSTADRPMPQLVSGGLANWPPAAPALDTPSGTLSQAQYVTLTSPVSGATIRYTRNGADPTEDDPTAPSDGRVSIPHSTQLRARAFTASSAPGPIARADYQVMSVTMSPASGLYAAAQTVVISSSEPLAIVRFTIDGTDPTPQSAVYSTPLEISTATVVKARAFTTGVAPSASASATYAFNYGSLELPAVVPQGGAFVQPPQVLLSTIPGGAIRYTLNGVTPTAASDLYTGPISIPSTGGTLKAVAFHPDWAPSGVRSEGYSVDSVAPTILGYRSPAALNAWQRTPVTVTFVCNDNVAVASCSEPITVSAEGAAQTVTGSAVDTAGNQATQQETVNIDLTPPVLEMTAPFEGLLTTATTVMVTGSVSDTLSGVAVVNCNGQSTPVVDGAVACEVTLRPGRNAVALTARDAAGHSVSAGVTVTRVGTSTRIALTPSARTMLVNETGTLSLLDDFGAAVAGATWYSSNPAMVSLSPDDPPILTAVATGLVTISAIKNGLSSHATMRVVEGEDLVEGTTQWTVPPTPVWNQRRDPPIYAHRVDASSPHAFVIETDLTTWERTVRAISGTGEVQWSMVAPGIPLMGDTFGGLIAGVEPAPNTCRAVFDEFENCYKALARFAGPSNTVSWRYDSPGLVDRPAQGRDGTVYFIEHLQYLHKSLVILNGATGAVAARVPLANLVFDQFGCPPSRHEIAPDTVGPIVGADGLGYLLVRAEKLWQRRACGSQTWEFHVDRSLTLLRLSSEGAVPATVIEQCSGHCATDPRPQQLLPDGMGGLLILARWGFLQNAAPDVRLTRLDADGARSDVPFPPDTRIELVGQAGRVYLHTKHSDVESTAKDVIDARTGAPIWSLPVEWNWIAAAPDGGAIAERAGELARFAANGEFMSALPLELSNPVAEEGRLVGNTTYGLRAVEFDFADATRWDATFMSRGYGAEEIRGFGGRQSDSQVRRPGVGIFVKSHLAEARFGGIIRYRHLSIRVTPRNQTGWQSYFAVPADQFGNRYFTFGAGPGTDTTWSCDGTLVSGVNRSNDVTVPPLDPIELLPYSAALEDALIQALLDRYIAYDNDLQYACFPENDPGYYNSNSFAAGLLRAATLPAPRLAHRLPALFPGVRVPVPLAKFQ